MSETIVMKKDEDYGRYKMTHNQLLELQETLTQDILDRYDAVCNVNNHSINYYIPF